MKKLLNIAFKDLTVVFRDRGAVIYMLATPFLLTLAMAFAFGRLTGGGSQSAGIEQIPVVIVNHDSGQFGQYITQTFESKDLANLVKPTTLLDDAAARLAVDNDQAVAAVIVPADFSSNILPTGATAGDAAASSDAAASPDAAAYLNRKQSVIEVYSSPVRPINAAVVRSIVDRILSRLAAGVAGAQVSIAQLLTNGLVAPNQLQAVGQAIGARASQAAAQSSPITVNTQLSAATASNSGGFDWLGYMAPSMAIMFLMFTVTTGGRSILTEREWGTLPRMLATPTTPAQVVGGKIAGTYFTGAAQMFILIVFGGLAFQIHWGAPVAVVLLTLALVAAATSWGMLIAAYSRSPGQAASLGTAVVLIFAGLAGNFVPRQLLPQWLQTASYISPNAWGLEGFLKLAGNGTLTDVLGPIVALLIMAAVLFSLALLAFRRQYA